MRLTIAHIVANFCIENFAQQLLNSAPQNRFADTDMYITHLWSGLTVFMRKPRSQWTLLLLNFIVKRKSNSSLDGTIDGCTYVLPHTTSTCSFFCARRVYTTVVKEVAMGKCYRQNGCRTAGIH